MSRNSPSILFCILGIVMLCSCSSWKNNPSPINLYSDFGKEGKWISRHDSTQMLIIQWYKKGKENGMYVQYFDNGLIAVSGRYKNGLKIGNWKSYISNGSMVRLSKYKKGKVIQNTMINPRF